MDIADINTRINARGAGPKNWNQFQSANKGFFRSRAQAGQAWRAFKRANNITAGSARSVAQRGAFLRGLADSRMAPKWMNQWLRKGNVPPGFEVDHIKPFSVGGADLPSNMRLLDRAFHKLHHSPGFYRPWL